MQALYVRLFFLGAMLISIANPVWAEEAPVYEVDNYPPSFETQQNEAIANDNSVDISRPSPTLEAARPPASISDRLARLEQQLNNLQQTESITKIESLQRELASLRGEIEEISHQLQQTQKIQQTTYADFDKRLSNLTLATTSISPQMKRPTPATSLAAAKSTPLNTKKDPAASVPKHIENNQPNVAEEQKIYQTAYDLIKSKKYNEAIVALQKMLQRYPTGQFAANAHYWLGELYSLLNKNEQAAKEFSYVINNFPDSPKVSEAQLQLGLIYAAQFKWSNAKTTFKNIINHYPGTTSARLANEQLKQIKQAGH